MITTSCSTCNKPVTRSATRIGNHKKIFCNAQCQASEYYQWLGYVLQNYHTMTHVQMAAHIGANISTFKSWCRNFKKALAGTDIWLGSYARPRKPRKKPVKPKKVPIKVVVPKKIVKAAVVKEKAAIIRVTQHHAINMNKDIKASAVFNPLTHKMVKVDRRTTVQALRCMSDESVIENWYKKWSA